VGQAHVGSGPPSPNLSTGLLYTFFTSSDYEAAQELKIITQKDHKYVPDMGQCQRD